MSEQSVRFYGTGLQFTGTEINIVTNRKSIGVQRVGHLGGTIVGMDPDLTKVMTEALLKAGSVL